MAIVRYLIEHLPKSDSAHHPSQRTTIRAHTTKHVWARLDDDTIVVMGHFADATRFHAAASHPNVVGLPHLHDATPIKQLLAAKPSHAGKFAAMKKQLKLDDSHSTVDLIGKLLAAGHVHFEPSI